MKKFVFVFLFVAVCGSLLAQNAIEVVRSGKGNVVIYLPGFTTPGSVWDETIKNVNGENENHVVSYAGFNGIEPIGTPWYETIKNQLIKYIKDNDLKNVTVIGHSMGGSLAIEIASELPKIIKSLILVESIPCMRELMMPGVPASNIQYDSPYNNQLLVMTNEAFKKMAGGMSQYMTNSKSKVETLTDWAINADRKTYVYGYTDLLKLDLRETLKNVKAKTLILGASFPTKDIVLANYEKQYLNLISKEILIADNSKHFIMFDQPEWFYNSINDFLKKNE